MTGRLKDNPSWTQNEDGSFTRYPGHTSVLEPGAQVDKPEEAGAGGGGYDDMTKAELEQRLETLGLSKSGNKDELISRLKEYDAA
jgi:hypothetical protein